MAHSLEIRRSSASLWGGATGIRQLPVVSKYIDTTTCIGCKACEVACQEWNDLGTLPTRQTGTYQTLPALDAQFWNLIRFHEQELPGGMTWLIGCGYCSTGCPFDVPKFQTKTGKMAKCTLCVDRVEVGLEPACVKACPTGCLQFGSKTDMLAMASTRVEQLKANGFAQAAVYDPPGVGGTGVITILAHGDHPEWYGLPVDPHVPLTVRVWKTVLRPLGFLAMIGAVLGVFGHYLTQGPKEAEEAGKAATSPPGDRGHEGGRT